MKKEIIMTGLLFLLASLLIFSNIAIQDNFEGSKDEIENIVDHTDGETNLQTFDSREDLDDFLEENQKMQGGYSSFPNLYSSEYFRQYKDWNSDGVVDAPGLADRAETAGDDDVSSGEMDYSKTNTQEKDVDEGDVVKTDGNYAYIVSNDGLKVHVLDINPSKDSKIISEIGIEDGRIQELYRFDDKLVVLGTRGSMNPYGYFYDYDRYDSSEEQRIFVMAYNINDRSEPILFREDTINGSYASSRVIDGYIYVVSNFDIYEFNDNSTLPAPADEIHYMDDYDSYYTFIKVTSIDLSTDEKMKSRTMLFGYSSEIYVSTGNIYVTKMKTISWVEETMMEIENVIIDILPFHESEMVKAVLDEDLTASGKIEKVNSIMGSYLDDLTENEKDQFYSHWEEKKNDMEIELSKEREKTLVQRISIDKGFINFKASGEVPGYLLNRFSMGEYDGYFRIATTTGHVSRTDVGTAKNHVFVMDMDLEVVGNISDIAPGERIYSARFMGERAYLVTFDKVDPFFFIDLSDPFHPEILGELKIPGYSDYLHVYDENHVIGLGKDTVLAEGGQFSWYQGVKLSLFDVTDYENPKEIAKYIIGDRGTYSIAQDDPHAFLFSLSRNLLVIPISLYEIDEGESYVQANTHGDYVWEGAYVFHVSPEAGFQLEGRISHNDDDNQLQEHYWRSNEKSIYRSFYVNDDLFTVSKSMMMVSNLDSLEEVTTVELPYEEPEEYYWYD